MSLDDVLNYPVAQTLSHTVGMCVYSEGLAQQFEGLAQQFEGLAQQIEGLAQQFEGLAQQFEGLAQQIEENCVSFRYDGRHCTYEDCCSRNENICMYTLM
jgi:hypothetical protein